MLSAYHNLQVDGTAARFETWVLALCLLLGIFEAIENGKPAERQGRKTSGLRTLV